MICELYTLKKEYRDKNIYIWGVNRDSVNVFTMVALRKLDVRGFISTQEEYVGEMFVNRPVVSYKQIGMGDDIVILVPDEICKDELSVLSDSRVVYWSESLEIDAELRNRDVIIYGTGYGAERLSGLLDREEIRVQLYCVTKKENSKARYKGKQIIEAAELQRHENCAVIISVLTLEFRREILQVLSDFQGQIYIENIIIGEIGTPVVEHINLMQNLDYAIKRHAKVYLYSNRNAFAKLMEAILHIYGVELDAYVGEVPNADKDIKSIYELVYDGVEDKLIIINEDFPERLIRARENVELAGFSLEERNYTGLQFYTRADETLLLNTPCEYDSLVGYSILYKHGKPGWEIYGREDVDRIKILILGGSTSAEVWHPENWVSKLYHKLNRDYIKTTIYNGAHEGNSIVEEMLRLLRDGNVIRPHIVISLSGINDTGYRESANQFNESAMISWIKSMAPSRTYCSGLESDEPLYSFWNRNVKIQKLVSEFYGANFFCFLQPMNIAMQYMTLWEKSVYERELTRLGAKNFEQSAGDGNDYINMLKLFEGHDEMYFDRAHYTDKAHEVIAENVYEVIMPTIQRIKNNL